MSTLLASFSRRTFAQYLHRDGISYKIRHGLRKSVFNHQAIWRRYCAVPHMAWQDIICHLLHLPARRAIYNNNRSPWYLLIHHNKMSLEIFHFHSPGFLPFFFLFPFSRLLRPAHSLPGMCECDLWPWVPWLTEHYEMLIGHVTIHQTVIYYRVKCGGNTQWTN